MNIDMISLKDIIPKGTTGVELGVWLGDSSKRFLDMGIRHLHLVDAWNPEAYFEQSVNEFGSVDNYLNAYSHQAGGNTKKHYYEFYEKMYNEVHLKLLPYSDRVTFHRQTTLEFFNANTELFDWIYVDAGHAHEEVYTDLYNCVDAIKPGGFIIGDDYSWTPERGKAGATSGVNQFIKETGLTLERFGAVQYKIALRNKL